jgi:hypothetical protein
VVLGLLLFRTSLFLGEVFYKRDIHLVWHAQVEAMVRAVAEGAWPVWNPHPAFGQPLLATPDVGVVYPPTWLNLILRPWLYYTLFAVGHFLLGAFGMRALARQLGFTETASLVSATLWALSGPFLSMVDLWHHFAGAAWMPWTLWAADRALGGGRRDVAVLGLVLGGQILAGSADMCALSLLVAAGLGAARHLGLRRPRVGASLRAVARGAAGVLLAVGIGAVLWLGALELLSVAARADLPEGVRTYWSVHPALALEMLVPRWWTHLSPDPSLHALFFESREPFLSSLYLGAGSLAFVVAGAFASGDSQRRVLIAILVTSLLLAFGAHTPAYGIVTTLVPPLRILRYPVKIMIVVALAWALLAGLGVDAWRDARARRVGLCLVAASGLVVVLALGIALLARFPPDLPEALDLARRWRLASTFLVGATGLALGAAALAGRLGPDRAKTAAIALAFFELAAFHRAPNPTAPEALYTHRPEVVGALEASPSARVYVYDYGVPGKAEEHFGPGSPYALARSPAGWDVRAATALGAQMYLAPDTAGRWGLSQAYNMDLRGLHSRPMARLESLLRRVEGTPAHLRLLQIGGVTHVIALHDVPGLVDDRSFPGLFERPILLKRVPDPLPRAFVVGAAVSAGDDEALALLQEPGFDFRTTALLADGESREAPPGFRGDARVVESRADRVAVEAELDAPGFLVLLDSYDRGWRVRVDGKEVRLHRANLVFRAVSLEAGRHRVELRYRPRGLAVGLLLSVTALAAALVLLVRGPRA